MVVTEVLDGPAPEVPDYDRLYLYAIFELQRSLLPRYAPRFRLLQGMGFDRLLTAAEERDLFAYWLEMYTPSPVTFTVEFL